jgi:hypothetical protein
MRRMSSSLPFSLIAVVAAATLAVVSAISPAQAGGNVSITDGDGVDYDAACAVRQQGPPPPPNSVRSPGLPGGTQQGGDGCQGTSTYDGSTESTDIRSVSLASDEVTHGVSDVQLVATCTMDAPIPFAGDTTPPLTASNPDLPGLSFVGSSCKVMFQVPARQNSRPTNDVGGGAPRSPRGDMYDVHGHWMDGYHHFVGFDVQWDGTRWIHLAKIGTYDPLPTGGFTFTELGTDNGSAWQNADLNAQVGVHWNVTFPAANTVRVTVDGVLASTCNVCVGGVFNTVYAKDGDSISNVKGLSTTNAAMVLPATMPLSLVPGGTDVTVFGGFVHISDTTGGLSGNYGIVGATSRPNIVGIAYTPGPMQQARAGEWPGVYGNGPTADEVSRFMDSATWGVVTSLPDTYGAALSCWTPTWGGDVPPNPLFNAAFGCHYDDDNIPVPNSGNPGGPWTAVNPGERGSLLPEFWPTTQAFVA